MDQDWQPGRRRSRGRRGRGSMFMDGFVTKRSKSRFHEEDDDDLSRTMNGENRPKTAAELSMENQLKNETHNVYPIGGVKIKFPCKPYPSQFSMMGMIVKGLERSQNCLLESPTGSGKSLALLCSVLAWQQAQKEKIRAESSAEAKEGKECSCKGGGRSTTSPYFSETLANLADESISTEARGNSSVILVSDEDDDDDDFKKPVKKLRTSLSSQQGAAGGRQHISIGYDATPTATGATPTFRGGATPMDEDRGCCDCQCQQDLPPNRRTPKIYFGTRTHKQIAQIARELAKTAYPDVRLTILSSREQSCIDLEVSKLRNKSEACKEKRDGVGCLHFENVRKVSHRNLEVNGLELAWDLEDLVGFCKTNKACPYYGARGLREGADIIFCPYNYLIDPVIRTQMEISLKDEVVVLDEAHNMEDAAREAASYSVSHIELEEAVGDFNRVIAAEVKIKEHQELLNVVTALGQWIDAFKDSLGGDNYDNANRVWNGVDMVAQLKKSNIGPDSMDRIQKALGAACEEDPKDPPKAKIANPTGVIIEKTLFVLGYIFRDNYKFMNDYRIALVRTMSYAAEQTDGEWLGRGRRRSYQPTWLFTLHFWCMNPAVAFSDLADTRSIILTSGTLSPMNTFQSELSQPFPIQLEANHVINSKQVWVGAVSKGPRGNSLLGTYQNAETFTYQDEIGELARSVCKTVPHGVLCFLSSYRMMDKLLNRWQSTGLYEELKKYKVMMKEPRKSDGEKVDFDELLKEFYATIKETEHAEPGKQTGVFFMAVCRGKVSEGMDFADNNARAVITVGIPFPNVKDTQVGLKKKYNNEHIQKRGLLTGQDWYEIQAYRAINQALGRCIRHRYDWGALILVDERFAKNPAKYTKGLSKWVRNKVQYHGNYNQMQRSLQEFTENMVTTPPGPGQDLSMSLAVSQMDVSVAMDTTQRPYSPAPPVLPPHPASSTSPPMDLNPPQTPGGATGHTSSSSASHTGAPGYMLPSQAGGFMVSQNQSLVSQPMLNSTVSGVAGRMQPSQTQEDVLAAPPDTQHMDLDQTLEFAPPMAASTQRPGRLSFNPGYTSTQQGTQQTEAGFLDVSLIKPPFKTPVKSDVPSTNVTNHGVSPVLTHCSSTPSNRAAPLLSLKQKTLKKGRKSAEDDDPDFEITRSQSAKTSGTSKRLVQSVDLTVRCGDEEFDIDERSSSPLLFGSEDGDEAKKTEADFDAVVEHLADTTLPRETFQVQELKSSESEPNLGVKRLFKPIKNTIIEENTVSVNDSKDACVVTKNTDKTVVEGQDENIPPVLVVEEPAKPKHAKGRLSRRRSKDSMNSSLLTQTPDDKSKQSDKAAEAIQINSNQSAYIDLSKSKSITQAKLPGDPRPATKRIAKGVNFISDEEDGKEELDEIVTKRAYRNKRRRVWPASSNASTSDFLDDVQDIVKMEMSEAVCCKSCGIRLTKGMEGVREEDLPGYVRSAIPTRDQRNVDQKSSVCNYGDTCISTCRPLDATGVYGVKLNSVWSEEAGCCLVLYRCPSSQCSKVPVAVRITATAAKSTATEGQVWFLPHATAVSEPT